MKTKTIEETFVNTVTVYEAEDGTVFAEGYKCKEYEMSKNLELLNENVENCSELEGCPNFDGGECLESNDFRWYYIKTKEDLELLNKVYTHNDCLPLSDDYIRKWICLEISQDFCCWVTTLDDALSYARRILDRLGYEFDIRKKEIEDDK